jgi:hypothetical protein
MTRLGQTRDAPLVSALMVTRDRAALAACSIECFRRQTWPQRELVIVDDGPDQMLAEHVRQLDDPRIRMVRLADAALPLGALRNHAVAEARGELICQWDDDDLSHPNRMELQVAALTAFGGEACVLARETLWWPRSGRVALSQARLWESSLLARRATLPPYPELRRGEDTPVIEALAARGRLVLLDRPHLHVYVVHGGNSFPATHFERAWEAASERHDRVAADTWAKEQATVLPLAQMRAAVASSAPVTVRVAGQRPRLLLLTPVKDAAAHLGNYLDAVRALDWPPDGLSLGLLESDSRDGSHERLTALRPELERRWRRVQLYKRDFGFHLTDSRWNPAIQRRRRAILARARNELLARTLTSEDEWVLWLDADLAALPPDLIQRLLAPGKDVVVPHVVSAQTGDTFDLNTWRLDPAARHFDFSPWLLDGIFQPPRGVGRQYLGQLQEHELVEVDAVGGCALLVRADLHRAGVVFPEQPIAGLIETEGLAVLAQRQGSACFGLPRVRVVHS